MLQEEELFTEAEKCPSLDQLTQDSSCMDWQAGLVPQGSRQLEQVLPASLLEGRQGRSSYSHLPPAPWSWLNHQWVSLSYLRTQRVLMFSQHGLIMPLTCLCFCMKGTKKFALLKQKEKRDRNDSCYVVQLIMENYLCSSITFNKHKRETDLRNQRC